ncbi:AFG1/ZapE family ATPase, partial [Klebsiella pneumoniae]|uniref:AFG1/ZapE family ATPase n=1 Tax=Klebsiella pneumoniae TaxID=573 RepID=UPI00215AD135
MTLATRTVTLPGGLQATLVHQPQADRAAALARVAAGSHHEPSRFPGLAHLLEHLFQHGIVLLATSNYPPEMLLPNPLYHDRFLPSIALIRA